MGIDCHLNSLITSCSVHLWEYFAPSTQTRLGMSVTTQGGSGRQYVTGPGRNISKYRFVLLNVYRFREIKDTINCKYLILSLYVCPRHLSKLN